MFESVRMRAGSNDGESYDPSEDIAEEDKMSMSSQKKADRRCLRIEQ